jgi:SAM-dependent methyltransferase
MIRSAMLRNEDVVAAYDAVADVYAERFSDELDHKPLDRRLLDELAVATGGRGPVCDLGCGPGHVARYLAARGADVFGVDLSPGMVAIARRLHPELRFAVGDALALELADASLAGVVALYSLIHLPRAAAPRAAAEIHRVLRPGGLLLASFHAGAGELHTDEFLGQPVSIDATLFELGEMTGVLRAAGLAIESALTRPPIEGFEYPTTRAYVLASRPG